MLGDNCQAIYDYQSEDMSSKEFYEEIGKNFQNIVQVSYNTQKRLSETLDKKATYLRAAIESKDVKIINNLINQILENIPLKEIDEVENGVILTRKNGKVYDISRKLEIKHNILNNSNNINYPYWIGFIFGSYKKETIKKSKFAKIIRHKLKIKEKEKIHKYWEYCKQIENEQEEILDIKKMHRNIIISDNIDIDDIEEKENVTISTIHKAKGKEFEFVFLDKELEENIDKESIIEYAKLLYVAITRAKNNCYKIKFDNNYYKRYYNSMPKNDRYFEYTYKDIKNCKGHTKMSIRKIEIGLENDVDKTSFINDEIVGNAQENIEYIKNNIKKGDFVDLILENGKYFIYHNKRKIGKMNIDDLYESVQKHLNRVKKMSYKPLEYSKVKVKRIATIAAFSEFIPSEIRNIYSKTGMWIGVELEGFGELKWNN